MTESFSLLTDFDVDLFKSGKHFRLYEKLGSRKVSFNGEEGLYFAVWAPRAQSVSVIGDFNRWLRTENRLKKRKDDSGIWEGFFPELDLGIIYKYAVETPTGEVVQKIDPFAFAGEIPPKSASVAVSTWYKWKDGHWMRKRKKLNSHKSPISVYELHLGSWKRDPDDPHRWLTYVEIADKLIEHILKTGFTHVEFMPVMEHPYPPSWGYQITGYFSADARYGTPQELMYLIEQLHKNDIGVILDWVPSHFPNDGHGLFEFDGTHLYEYEDPRKGYHPDWKSSIFDYGKPEVRSFLISNALFWLDIYHADGLRVDAVTSMVYLNYSRKDGEWIPNIHGGAENLEAISFLKELNETVYMNFPDILMIAEESSDWPGVTRRTVDDGLGFGLKWMMGWMNDTLDFFKTDPLFRKGVYHKLTFSSMYAFSENYILPLSHDEVVHGKSSLIYKMPGDEQQKFANLRVLYLYMFTHPGCKLLFMGGEFAQTREWSFDHSLDWHLLDFEPHRRLMEFLSELNRLYRSEKALYLKQFEYEGFEWLEADDPEQCIYSYVRKSGKPREDLMIILNLTPVVRKKHLMGFPQHGIWRCILNSDSEKYWGSGMEKRSIKTREFKFKGHEFTAKVTLPPLSGLIFKLSRRLPVKKKKKSKAAVVSKKKNLPQKSKSRPGKKQKKR